MRPKLSDNLQKTGYSDYALDLYRQNARDIQASSSGIERYVIGLFGPDLMGSLALAFDPYKQFHNFPRRTSLLTDGSKIVRTRTIKTSRGFQRKESWKRKNLQYTYLRNPQKGLFDYYYLGPVYSQVTGTTNRGDQLPLYGVIIDTTRRTRPIKHTGGEFELFAPRVASASRDHTFLRGDTLVTNQIGSGQHQQDLSWTQSRVTGPEFLCTNAQVQTLLPGIRARALASLQDNVLGMLDRVQPRHKTYDLVYQIAELRDLPRTIRGTLEIWRSFERLIGSSFFQTLLRSASSWRDPSLLRAYASLLGRETGFFIDASKTLIQNASSAFLTFKFGWESMVRGAVQFLPSPSRVAREVNYLVKSIGEDRTFRTKKSWIEPVASFPAFSTQLLKDEQVDDFTVRTVGHRKCELRLTANFTINFPEIELPRLRQELFLRKIGASPSPSDLYNLIPWTWLLDWFTGLGDYVQLLDTISNDRSIINHGFITYREVSESSASVRGKFTTTVTRNINGVSTVNSSVEKYLHEGKFFYTYQIRRSIPSLTNVKSIWDPSLGPSQSAIIGALLGSRSGSAGRRDAS